MRLFALLLFGLIGVAPLGATEPATLSYADYQRLLTWKLTTGKLTVMANDSPQSVASISASDSTSDATGATRFTLSLGSTDNPKTIKYEYPDGHPIDELKAIDAIFLKALDWKDIATAHEVETITKSLGLYNRQEYFFRVTGDDFKDGIYLDLTAKSPTFTISTIKQLHTIFAFLVFLDGYQGGEHLLESYLQDSRHEADALFK